MASHGRLCESPQLTAILFTSVTIMLFKVLGDHMIKHECLGLGIEGRMVLAFFLMGLAYSGTFFGAIELAFYCKCQ